MFTKKTRCNANLFISKDYTVLCQCVEDTKKPNKFVLERNFALCREEIVFELVANIFCFVLSIVTALL